MGKRHTQPATQEEVVTTKKYYKTKDGSGWLSFRPSVSDEELARDYIELTEEEWNEHLASLHHEPSAEQLHKREVKHQIASLKQQLANTDYVVIKIAESTDEEEIASLREEYASVIAHRKELREQINSLEEELN